MAFGRVPWPPVAGGCLVVAVNGLAAHVLNASALRARSSEAFILLSLGGSITRILAVLAVVACVYLADRPYFMPFLAIVLSGYFFFLAWEITCLLTQADGQRSVS